MKDDIEIMPARENRDFAPVRRGFRWNALKIVGFVKMPLQNESHSVECPK
jgi:hypothetical protein